MDSRINSATDRRFNESSSSQPEIRKASIKNNATVKRNLNDKLNVSNVEIRAFNARTLHRCTCYRNWLLINNFNARGSSLCIRTQICQSR